MPTSGFGSVQRAYNRFGIATNAMENALRPMTLKFIRTYELALELVKKNGKRVDHMLIFYCTDCKRMITGKLLKALIRS
jgi:hypothetical protein